jgi:RNA polymerase sigma-70 factor (ECF subfamily)
MNEINTPHKTQFSLEALHKGDRNEFARLVDATSAQIYRLALRITGHTQDAEDVLQETYLKALKALPTFEGRSNLSTWLYRIAANEALMLLRKRRPDVMSVEDSIKEDDESGESLEIVDWCCLPEKELLNAESRKHLDQVIDRLPVGLKTVFLLRDVEGLSIHETAEVLGISEMSVKTRLLRARLHLRQDLSVYFGERLVEKTDHE